MVGKFQAAISPIRENGAKNANQGDNRIEIQGDRGRQNRDRVANIVNFYQAVQKRPPAIHKNQDTDRRAGRIDNIRKPFPAHFELVKQGAPHNAGRKQADIGIHKQKRACKRRYETGPLARIGHLRSNQFFNQSRHASRSLHKSNQSANDQTEQDHTGGMVRAEDISAALDRIEQPDGRIAARNNRLGRPDGAAKCPEHIACPDRNRQSKDRGQKR